MLLRRWLTSAANMLIKVSNYPNETSRKLSKSKGFGSGLKGRPAYVRYIGSHWFRSDFIQIKYSSFFILHENIIAFVMRPEILSIENIFFQMSPSIVSNQYDIWVLAPSSACSPGHCEQQYLSTTTNHRRFVFD